MDLLVSFDRGWSFFRFIPIPSLLHYSILFLRPDNLPLTLTK